MKRTFIVSGKRSLLDRGGSEQSQIALQKGDPALHVAIAAMVQERPHQGRPKPPGHHRQNQNIDLLGSDAPVRSIERQGDWPIASSASG
jgi:hypothetical protein